jgi:histidine triad (HIT) family protein
LGTEHSRVSDPSCEFCRIIRGETDAHIVWEDGSAMAFFPLAPAVAGHTLVVPKDHVTNYWAAGEPVVQHLASAVLLVGVGIQRALQPDGMNLISSAGEAASQSVFHLHMHVVPRWSHDRIGQIWPPDKHLPPRLEDDLADRVREGIRRSAVRRGNDDKGDADAKNRDVEDGDRLRPQ